MKTSQHGIKMEIYGIDITPDDILNDLKGIVKADLI